MSDGRIVKAETFLWLPEVPANHVFEIVNVYHCVAFSTEEESLGRT
jgi:hypothetical protein